MLPGFKRYIGKRNRRERFLAAYEDIRTIAGAARLACVHRSTVHRWLASPSFRRDMDAAWQRGYQRWFKEVYEPELAARRAAKAQRKQH